MNILFHTLAWESFSHGVLRLITLFSGGFTDVPVELQPLQTPE